MDGPKQTHNKGVKKDTEKMHFPTSALLFLVNPLDTDLARTSMKTLFLSI